MKLNDGTRKALIMLAASIVTLGIAWIDFATGRDSDVFLFYYVPVAIVTWYSGLWAGLLIAVLSAANWLASDVMVRPDYSWFVESWDTTMRLASFLILAVGIYRVQRDLLREKALNKELSTAMLEIKQLSGILPMCSFCRKIRDDTKNWVPLEQYIADHSDAQVSHGLCPHCYRKHYGSPDGT